MLAYANREAVEKTLATGEVHFWSRSRQELWRKGATSGNVLHAVSVTADCDQDALLVRAHPAGPTCHKGTRSCFEPNPAKLELGWLAEILAARKDADPKTSYTARLLQAGVERVAQKVGEEAVETVIASLTRNQQTEETADLLYHLLVLLQATDLDAEEVARELRGRHTSA